MSKYNISLSAEERSLMYGIACIFKDTESSNTFISSSGEKLTTFDKVTLTEPQLALLSRLSEFTSYKLRKLFEDD